MGYDFVIIGRKEEDSYVIQDVREGMGGKCCCTRYTLMQLYAQGYKILGINKLSNKKSGEAKITAKDITVYNLDGSVCQRIGTYPSVDATKRSASTIRLGLKISRSEQKQRKEVSKKRVQTLKANKKEVEQQKKIEEKKAKEEAIKKKKEQQAIERLGKTRYKSKPLFILKALEVTASEYEFKQVSKFDVELTSKAAITTYVKGLLNGRYKASNWGVGEDSSRKLNDELKRKGKVIRQVERKGIFEGFDEYQIVSANNVDYSFENLYEDYEIYGRFVGKKKEPDLKGRHVNIKDVLAGESFGSSAGSEETVAGIRSYLIGLGYIK